MSKSNATKMQIECIKEHIEYIDACLEKTLSNLKKKESYYPLDEKGQFKIEYMLNSILIADTYCEDIIRKIYQNVGFVDIQFKGQDITLLVNPKWKKTNEELEYFSDYSSLEELVKINNEIMALDLKTSCEHIIDVIDDKIENNKKNEDISTEIWNVRLNFETSYKIIKKYIHQGFKKVDFCLGIHDKENLIVKLKA